MKPLPYGADRKSADASRTSRVMGYAKGGSPERRDVPYKAGSLGSGKDSGPPHKARGGAVEDGTKINITIGAPPTADKSAQAGALLSAMAPKPPAAPAMAGPAMPPTGGPPPGLGPRPLGMKTGGRMTAGAESGPGRLEKTAIAAKNRKNQSAD